MTSCEQCNFTLYTPIKTRYKTLNIGLYDDNRYPGRLIVSLKEHHEEIENLPEDLYIEYLLEIKNIIQTMKHVLHVERINFSILGNTVPHIHAHLIPRKPENEPNPHKSPWSRSDKNKPLPLWIKETLIYLYSEKFS